MSVRLAAAAAAVLVLAGCAGGSSVAAPKTAAPKTIGVMPAAGAQTVGLDTGAPVALGRTVTATAEGRAEGAPDLLTVSLGVQTQNRSAQAALADNAAKAQALIAKLKADGVADKDIQTSQLQVSPQYTNGGPSTPPTITGFEVTNMVTAKLRQLGKAGVLIDDAVAAAGDNTRVNSFGYSIDDSSALVSAARADAVHRASAHAKAMADAAGVALGPVRAITDSTAPHLQPMYAMAAPTADAAGRVSTPLQPGTQQLTVQVVVVFDLA